jgi:hypothetical protein
MSDVDNSDFIYFVSLQLQVYVLMGLQMYMVRIQFWIRDVAVRGLKHRRDQNTITKKMLK